MKENRRLLVILTTVFICATILLGGYVIYDKVLKKDVIQTNDGHKENGKLYHVEDGEKFMIYGKNLLENDQLINRNIEISFAYPVIDINTDEIKKVNSEIYEKYQSSYRSNLNNKVTSSSCVAIRKNDQFYGGSHILYNTYRVYETSNYLSIVIIDEKYTECASGNIGYVGYVINKDTKKLMTNKEILRLFNAVNNEKVFIDEYNKAANIFEYSKITNIEDANVLIYDNKLMLSIKGNGESLLKYDNGKLVDYYN